MVLCGCNARAGKLCTAWAERLKAAAVAQNVPNVVRAQTLATALLAKLAPSPELRKMFRVVAVEYIWLRIKFGFRVLGPL